MLGRLLVRADFLRLALVVFLAALLALVLPFAAMHVIWRSFTLPLVCTIFLSMIGLVYRWRGRDVGIAAACFVTAQLVVFSSLAALCNYAGLAAHRPLYDARLADIDTMFGVDWTAYVAAIKADPTIGAILTGAYESSLLQLPCAIAILAFSQNLARLDEFTLAFMIAAVATVAVWTAFPNIGEMQWLYAQGAPALPFSLAISREEALRVFALWRDGAGEVRFEDLTGLIGAPSFHTVMALLTLRALWGVRWIAAPALALNALVLAAVPADGGHHFVDMAAGALVTAFAVLAAKALLQPRERANAAVYAAPLSQSA